jgi:hypothetical protein
MISDNDNSEAIYFLGLMLVLHGLNQSSCWSKARKYFLFLPDNCCKPVDWVILE